MPHKKILILDFGSQYTQLIARRVRETHVYCELHPYDVDENFIRDFNPAGIILSGGPNSVTEGDTPRAPQIVFELGVPVLAGMSRKSMLGALTGKPVEQREYAGIAAHLAAVARGASILRVHDVAAMKDALAVWMAIEGAEKQ